jgi:hypothetical protein
VTVDGGETTLRSVIAGAAEGDTIVLAPGTYTFDEAGTDEYTGIYVTTPNITIRGSSADPTDVVLDSNYADHGMQTAVISLDAPGVVLAGFSVQRSIFHLIHLWENADDAIIFDVVMIDGGQQFLKASPGSGTVDGVEVACSGFFMTEQGRDNVWGYGALDGNTTCYTGGIDTHNARDWVVADNVFSGIYCDTDGGRPAHGKKASDRADQTYGGGLSEHAIHMWDSPEGSGHLVERNRIEDCARGIGLGLQEPVHGSIIRNNVIFSSFAASAEHDVAVIVERGVDTLVAHNTVFSGSESAYPNSIEIRWDVTSGVEVHGNLVSGAVTLRDGADALLTDNVTEAGSATYSDVDSDDFHLASCEETTLVSVHSEVSEDFDLVPRGDAPRAGAYQCFE